MVIFDDFAHNCEDDIIEYTYILVFNLRALLLYVVTINFGNPNSLIWWLFGP